MEIGSVIREKRTAQGLTQEQVAQALGVSGPAVNKWERGACCPDLALLAPLARLLDTDLNTLLSFREELTGVEIAAFTEELYTLAQSGGIDAAFLRAEELLHRWPGCDRLTISLAMTLNGLFFTLGVAEPEPYERRLEPLYRALADSEEPDIYNTGVYFRMTDGKTKTFNQLFDVSTMSLVKEHMGYSVYSFTADAYKILDLSQFKSVILNGLEYSLDNVEDYSPVDSNELLKPFGIDMKTEGDERYIPLKELLEGLQAVFNGENFSYNDNEYEIRQNSIVKNGDIVSVKADNERGTIFNQVKIRVDDSFTLEMHIDTDESNAAFATPGMMGEIIK